MYNFRKERIAINNIVGTGLFVLYLSQSAALRRSRIVEKITSERKEISDYGG